MLTAIEIKKAGVTSFKNIDWAGDWGGCWYWNRYPGIQCDNDAYCYLPLLEETGYMPKKMKATVAEIKRLAAKGFHAVAVSENPTKQGLPSIHNEYWEPFFKAIADNDMTVALHIGSGNPAPHASMETPIEAWISTMPMSVATGVADWLQLKALHDYPGLRIAISEGGIGWVPYFMERADYSNWRHRAWTHSAYECDYPHSDAAWPEVPERLWPTLKHLTDARIDKVTHLNAMRFFRFDLFAYNKRDTLTVGALRAQASAKGVDTSPKSSAGARPDDGTKRPITSGDIVSMFQKHAAERTAA